MPLLSPEISKIQKVLNNAGLGPKKDQTILERLEDSQSLNIQSSLDSLGEIMENGETGAIRLRAIETVLKLHGVLKDAQAPPPSITIIIKDASGNETNGINPILIPRTQTPQKIQ